MPLFYQSFEATKAEIVSEITSEFNVSILIDSIYIPPMSSWCCMYYSGYFN